MDNKQIRFTNGISRNHNAPLESPFSMRNCIIEKIGLVSSQRGASYMETGYPVGSKPWLKRNGKWLTRDNGVVSADEYLNRLYVSEEDRFYFLDDRDVRYSRPATIESVLLRSVDIDEHPLDAEGNTKSLIHGVTVNKAVDYILVPYNKNNEAGPWHYGTFIEDYVDLEDDVVITALPRLSVFTNTETMYVDVFRTAEYTPSQMDLVEKGRGRRKFWLFGDRLGSTTTNADVQETDGLYYAGRISLTDIQIFTNQFIREGEWSLDDYWPFDVYSTTQGVSTEIGPVMDRSINAWSKIDTVNSFSNGYLLDLKNKYKVPTKTYAILPPIAKCVYNHAGMMMYGNVSIPTKQPQVNYRWQSAEEPHEIWGAFLGFLDPEDDGTYVPVVSDASEKTQVMFQFEYQTDQGVVYGPSFISTAAYAHSVSYQGEQALLVFIKDEENKWRLWERIEPDQNGNYITQHQYVRTAGSLKEYVRGSDNGIGYKSPTTTLLAAFDAYSVTESKEINGAAAHQTALKKKEQGPKAATSHIELPNFVFMAEQNRPFEVTFNNFPLPEGESVVGISGARLAEEEGLRGYDFYVFSTNNVFVASRNGTTVSLDYVLNGVGVHETNNYGLIIPVRTGVIFYGSDTRLYYLSGRQVERLDRDIEGLWNEVIDGTYNEYEDRIELLTDTGIWMFDFEQRGWVGHRDTQEAITAQGAVGANSFQDVSSNGGGVLVPDEELGIIELDDDYVLTPNTPPTITATGDYDNKNFDVDVMLESPGQLDKLLYRLSYRSTEKGVFYVSGEATTETIYLDDTMDIVLSLSSTSDVLTGITLSVTVPLRDYSPDALIDFEETPATGIQYDRDHKATVIQYEDVSTLWDGSGDILPSPSVTTQEIHTTLTRQPYTIKADYEKQASFWPDASMTVKVKTLTDQVYSQTFPIPANRNRYPKLKGRQMQLEIDSFKHLHEILILDNTTLKTD